MKTIDLVYKIPPRTRIGHVHLKVADLSRSLDFYCGLLGFELISRYGEEAAFISAGGYHHHIGLNTWYSKNAQMTHKRSIGLFHTAILYPSKKDLAVIFSRLKSECYPLIGFSDHGVSFAIYLDDPDGNGVQLYWDKPEEEWPREEDGSLAMYTKRLNLKELIDEI